MTLSETNLMDNAVKAVAQRIDPSRLLNENDVDATFHEHTCTCTYPHCACACTHVALVMIICFSQKRDIKETKICATRFKP